MKYKTLIKGLVIPLVCALAVLGLIWAITKLTYPEPIALSNPKELEAPPLEFEGKYTVDKVAEKIGISGTSQSTNAVSPQEDVLVSLSINGNMVDFGESGPIISQGFTMVPIREVFEHLGFEVTWNDEAKRIVITNAEIQIAFVIGQMLYLFNDESFVLDAPARIINNKVMVPLRVILDCTGAEFEWSESDKLVKLIVN